MNRNQSRPGPAELTIPMLSSGAYGDIKTDEDILRALEEQGRLTRELVSLLSGDLTPTPQPTPEED